MQTEERKYKSQTQGNEINPVSFVLQPPYDTKLNI